MAEQYAAMRQYWAQQSTFKPLNERIWTPSVVAQKVSPHITTDPRVNYTDPRVYTVGFDAWALDRHLKRGFIDLSDDEKLAMVHEDSAPEYDALAGHDRVDADRMRALYPRIYDIKYGGGRKCDVIAVKASRG